ncbi:MAG: orotate phosphoribosyltransferase [Solirubrobacterales bacterium]
MKKDEAAKVFEKSGALLKGHFILTSGRHSDKYMQCAQVLQYPEYTEKLAKELAKSFEKAGVELVVGPAMGGIIVSYEVARQLGVQSIFCERENGKMALRRGFSVKPGQKILVVEDVITTGGSVKEVMDVVKAQGGVVVGVAVLVDRSSGSVDFGVKTVSTLTLDVQSWPSDSCPLCKEGAQPPTKPGSRS